MSLYIGSDYNGKKILHITNGSHDLNTMKSGIFSSTVFHNDMLFNTYKLISITGQENAAAATNDVPSPVYVTPDVSRMHNHFTVLQCDYDSIRTYGLKPGASIYYLNSNKNSIDFPSNLGFVNPNTKGSYSGCPGMSTYNKANTYITSSNCQPCLCWWRNRTQEINCQLPTVSNPGISFILIIYKMESSFGSGVNISNSNIQIGSLNLKNFKYVYSGTINNHPSSIQVTPYIQLIDSSQIYGSVGIVSDPGKVCLTVGGHNIIATDRNYYDITGGTSVTIYGYKPSYDQQWSVHYICATLGNLMYVQVIHYGEILFKGYISNYTNFSVVIYRREYPLISVYLNTVNGGLYFYIKNSNALEPSNRTMPFDVYYKYL